MAEHSSSQPQPSPSRAREVLEVLTPQTTGRDTRPKEFFTLTVAQLAQSSCGCLWIRESVQGQLGQGLEQPGAVEGVPAMAVVALDGL